MNLRELCSSFFILSVYSQFLFASSAPSTEFATWDAARKRCAQENSSLPSGQDIQLTSHILHFMKQNGIRAVWTSIRRNDFYQKTWINTVQLTKEFNRTEENKKKCYSMDSVSGDDFIEECRNPLDGCICSFQNSECSQCEENSICFQIKDTCFKAVRFTMSWYHARVHCVRLRGDLAVVQDEKVRQLIKDQLWTNLHHQLYLQYWIGATLIEWVDSDTNEGLRKYQWNAYQPNEQYKCVVLTILPNGTYGWSTRYCQLKTAFFCNNKFKIKILAEDMKIQKLENKDHATESNRSARVGNKKPLEKGKQVKENSSSYRNNKWTSIQLVAVTVILPAVLAIALVLVQTYIRQRWRKDYMPVVTNESSLDGTLERELRTDENFITEKL